jgi:hypothetical protein
MYPFLDSVLGVNEEVLVRDIGLPLWPPVEKGAAGKNTLEPPFLPNGRMLQQAQ